MMAQVSVQDALDGALLLSVDRNNHIPGFDGVKPSDILVFTPTSLGENTAGSLSWYLDGSDVGLSTDNEGVDAIAFAPDGRLVVSTWGGFNVPGASGAVRGQDEDLIVYNNDGTWELHFDGSDVGLGNGGDKEDVWGAWIDPDNGDIYLNPMYVWKVPGLQGDENDIPVFDPTTLGSSTSGSYSLFFDGNAAGLGNVSGFNALAIARP